jgi:Flp pilus assembly protein TadB
MRSFWSVSYAYSLVAAVACVVLFVIALVEGLGIESVAILAAGVFWVLMAREDRRRRR